MLASASARRRLGAPEQARGRDPLHASRMQPDPLRAAKTAPPPAMASTIPCKPAELVQPKADSASPAALDGTGFRNLEQFVEPLHVVVFDRTNGSRDEALRLRRVVRRPAAPAWCHTRLRPRRFSSSRCAAMRSSSRPSCSRRTCGPRTSTERTWREVRSFLDMLHHDNRNDGSFGARRHRRCSRCVQGGDSFARTDDGVRQVDRGASTKVFQLLLSHVTRP